MRQKRSEIWNLGPVFEALIDFLKRNREWVAHLNRKSILTSADIGILGELIDDANARQPT
jgi:hypothetical protein